MRTSSFLLLVLAIAGCDKLKPGASADDAGKAAVETKPIASASAEPTSAKPAASGETPAGAAKNAKTELDAPFEGEIDMRMTMPQMAGPMDVTYAIKGNKSRFDMEIPGAPKMWALFDAKDSKLYTVMDAQKMVMVIDASKASDGGKQVDWKAKKTGKTDTVAGQPCELWEMTGEKDQTKGQPASRYEVCIIKKASTFPWMALAKAQKNSHFAWSNELEKEGAIPLRTIGFDETGKETVRVETKRFERKKIDDSKLEVPKGYTTMNGIPTMPGMPKNLPGMPK